MHLRSILKLVPVGGMTLVRRQSWSPMRFFSLEKPPGKVPQINNAMTGEVVELTLAEIAADDWEASI